MPSLAIQVNNGTVTVYDTNNDMSIYWNSQVWSISYSVD